MLITMEIEFTPTQFLVTYSWSAPKDDLRKFYSLFVAKIKFHFVEQWYKTESKLILSFKNYNENKIFQ